MANVAQWQIAEKSLGKSQPTDLGLTKTQGESHLP